MNEKGEEELMYIENIVQKELPTTTSEAPVSTKGVSKAPVMMNGVPSQQKEASASPVASAGPTQSEQISTPHAASVGASETPIMTNGVPVNKDKQVHLLLPVLAPLNQSK